MIRLLAKTGMLGDGDVLALQLQHERGLTARGMVDLARRQPGVPQSIELVAAVNGRRLEEHELDEDLADGSDVVVVAAPHGIEIGVLLVYALISAAASFAINYLMTLLSPRPKAPGEPAERGDESSPTYAWDGIQTNFAQGFPVPAVYGRHAVGGQVIHTDLHATTAGGLIDDKLRMVLALSEGPIQAVGDVVAAELDELGGTAGGQPGAPLPDHIRVNGNVLQNPASSSVTQIVNVTTNVWVNELQPALSGSPPSGPGDLLLVLHPQTLAQLGIVRVVAIVNVQGTDLDLQLVSGAIALGNRLRYSIGTSGPRSITTITTLANLTRSNQLPGARAWIRPGSLDQRPLPSNPFRGASSTFTPSLQLNDVDEEQIYTHSVTDQISTVGFVLAFPSGLYALDPQGNLLPFPVRFDAYWRPQGVEAWRGFFRVATGGQSLPSQVIGQTAQLGPVLHSFGGDLVRPGDQSVTGPIEVRLVRRTATGGTQAVSACVWRNVFFNTEHAFAYPRVALLGLELSAGARFSGGLPNVVTRIDGVKVRVWDATSGFSPRTWGVPAAPFNFMTHAPGRNPAWVLLDFLTSPWGLGKFIKDADLDLPSFRRWAAFCDSDPSPATPWNEPAFQCDLAIDKPRPAWEWVLAICAAGRSSPVYRNGKIGVVYQYRDAHGDAGVSVAAKAPVQLLTSGNCEKVQTTWLPKANRPTAFLFQFLNETKLYTQDVLPVEDSEGTLNDPSSLRKEEWRPEAIQAYGVTRPSQVFREGVFRHRVQRLIRREITFLTGRWALAAEVGDLIDFEHELLRPFGTDVPLNMTIVGGGSDVTQVTVDHVALTATQIVIRDPDGKPQRRNIDSADIHAGGHATVFTLAAPVTCNPGATCVVGLADKLTETYEIVAVTLQKDLKREVRAVQWVPAVHDPVTPEMFEAGGVDGGEEDVPGFLAQPDQDTEPKITDLRVVPRRDGTHLIVFAKPLNRRNSSTRVYVRDLSLEGWILAGDTATEEIPFAHFVPGRTYDLAACLEGANGQHALPEDGVRIEFVADEFPPFAPPRVTNVRSEVLDEFLLLQWDDLDVRDLHHYEVRLGSDWAAGQVVYRERSPRALLGNPPGGGKALVAARSTSGLYGPPVLVTLPTWSPRNQVQVVGDDDLAPSPAGTHSSTQWNSSGYIELVAGALAGTYTSLEQDVGYQAPVYWQAKVDRAEVENVTIDELDFEIDSGEAHWRTVNGRPASPCFPGIDWQTNVDDLDMTLDDLGRRSDILVHGTAGEVGSHTRVLVESRFEIGGVWSAWKEHHDRTVVARKMQVRITLNRESERYEARVSGLAYAGFL